MPYFKHSNPFYVDPPGAYRDILAHPSDNNRAIEKVIFTEHRFAFFYWMLWYKELYKKKKIQTPPLLVSIDYHRDLAFILDINNREHKIYEFTDVNEFEKHLLTRKEHSLFFDIDLDYFVETEGNFSEKASWVMMEDKVIKKIIDNKRPFIKWIFERTEGFTIATEPRYCGGIQKSCKILSTIEEQLFTPDGEWKK